MEYNTHVKLFDVTMCMWHILYAAVSVVALPLGLVFLHSCHPVHLPAWLIFHGVLSITYYANAVHFHWSLPHCLRQLKEEYETLRQTLCQLSHHLGQPMKADDDIDPDPSMYQGENRGGRGCDAKKLATSTKLMAVTFTISYCASFLCGCVIVALHEFCVKWVYLYAVSFSTVSLVTFYVTFGTDYLRTFCVDKNEQK